MNNPNLYNKFSTISVCNTVPYIKKYIPLIKWPSNGEVTAMDVGCGAGNITNQYLLPTLPKSLKRLVAIDKSEDMVKFAKANWSTPKLEFKQFDVTSTEIPPNFRSTFDQIFSFYCFNWIKNQRQAFLNVSKMLTCEGNFLMTIITKSPIYEMYFELCKNGLWSPYVTDLEEHISHYRNFTDPVVELKRILEKSGLECIKCDVSDKTTIFEDLETYSSTIMGINAFIQRIPDDLKENYRSDCLNEIRKLGMIQTASGQENVIHTQTDMVVLGMKKCKRL